MLKKFFLYLLIFISKIIFTNYVVAQPCSDIPEPTVTISSVSICPQESVTLSIDEANDIYDYIWTFNTPPIGYDTLEGTKIEVAFNTTGEEETINVTLKVTHGDCFRDTSIAIQLKAAPLLLFKDNSQMTFANFTRCAEGQNPNDTLELEIKNNSISNDTSAMIIDIDWGDGQSEKYPFNEERMKHDYEKFGEYTITASSTHSITECTTVKQIVVENLEAPLTGIETRSPTSICEGESITIGNTSKNATHYIYGLYDEATKHLDTLLVTSSRDTFDFSIHLPDDIVCAHAERRAIIRKLNLYTFNGSCDHEAGIRVDITPDPRPTINAKPGFDLCFESSDTAKSVEFTFPTCPSWEYIKSTDLRFSIADSGNPIDTLLEDWDDESKFVHLFRSPGIYPLQIDAMSDCDTISYYDTLVISEPPLALFGNNHNNVKSGDCNAGTLPDMTPPNNCVPFTMGLMNESIGDTYVWSVSPIQGTYFGSPGTTTSISYDENITFTERGEYRITLTVTNEACGSTTSCAIVRAMDIPDINGLSFNGFEEAGFTQSISNDGDTTFYSNCGATTVQNILVSGLDTTVNSLNWNIAPISGTFSGDELDFNNDTLGNITFNSGSFFIDVKLSNKCGDTITHPIVVNILEAPEADAGGTAVDTSECDDPAFSEYAGIIDELVACSGNVIDLGNNDSIPGITYTWDICTPHQVDSAQVPNTTVTIINATTSNLCCVAYVDADNGTCIKRDSVLLVVKPAPSVYIGARDTIVCSNGLPFDLFADPEGGMWSSDPNIIKGANSIDPNTLSPGVAYELTYTFTEPGTGGCTIISTKTITAVLPDTADLLVDPVYCESNEPIDLSANPDAGTWSSTLPGAIINGNQLLTGVIGAGDSAVVYYDFTDGNSCQSKDSIVVNVISAVQAHAGLDTTFCFNDLTLNLEPGINTPFDPSKGSSWSGSGISSNGVLHRDSIGDDRLNTPLTFTYHYGLASCKTRDSLTVTIYGQPSITLPGFDSNYCELDDQIYPLTGVNVISNGITNLDPDNGQWSGNGVFTEEGVYYFNPSVAGGTESAHTLTYEFVDDQTANCLSRDSVDFYVHAIPVIDVNLPPLHCVNVPLILENESTIAFGDLGTSHWQLGNGDSLVTSFFRNDTLIFKNTGTFELQYTLNSNKNCSSSANFEMQIIDPPVANFSLDQGDNPCGPLTDVSVTNISTGLYNNYFWYFGLDSTGTFIQTNRPNDFIPDYPPDSSGTINYPVTLIAQNFCNSDTLIKEIQVDPVPVAILGIERDTICSPDSIKLFNASMGVKSDEPTTYTFYVSDGRIFGPFDSYLDGGGTRIEPVPDPIGFGYDTPIDTTTSFTITMVAENKCGKDTAVVVLIVRPNDITPGFNVDDTEGCSPFAINVTSFTQNATNYWYDFGDGTVIAAANTAHTYINTSDSVKKFKVVHWASNGCSKDSISQIITVYPQPKAIIELLKEGKCLGDTFSFANATTGNFDNPSWIFSDLRDTIYGDTVHYVFDTGSTHQVRLIVEHRVHQCRDTAMVVISPGIPPAISSLPDSVKGCAPLTIDLMMIPQDSGDIFEWLVKDTTLSVHNILQTAFNEPGIHPLIVVVTGDNDCSTSDSVFIEVYRSPNAVFTATRNTNPCVFPQEFQLNSKSSSDVRQHNWFWHGDTISSELNPLIVVNEPDSLKLSLLVKNDYGCMDSAGIQLIVKPTPVAQFSTVDTIGCVSHDAQFENLSKDYQSSFWDFGDGFTSEFDNPRHSFISKGAYDVFLIVEDEYGCRDSLFKQDYIHVYEKPDAYFDYEIIDDPSDHGWVIFYLDSLNGYHHTWILEGDTIENIDAIFEYQFENMGEVDVVHIVKNEETCFDTLITSLNIPFISGIMVPNIMIIGHANPLIGTFKPIGKGLKTYHCQVLDQFGYVIWESTLLNDNGEPVESWDGTYQFGARSGRLLKEDDYIWKIKATYIDGRIWPGMPPMVNGEPDLKARRSNFGTIRLKRQ